MESWSFCSTSIRRVFRVAKNVTTDPNAPAGMIHIRISFKNSSSI